MTNRQVYLFYGAVIGVLIPSWEYFGRASQNLRMLISTPSHLMDFVSENAPELAHATLITFSEAALGLALATVASLILIIVVFFSPALLRVLLPAMVASQVIPLIVLAPFFVIAFGIGLSSKVAMAAVLCFFPVFVGFAQGFKLISQNVHDLLDVFHAPRVFRIRWAYFPLSLPSGMAGLKISATLSVIGAIVAEFTGSEMGLGRNLFLSTIRLQPELMMASLLCATVLGGVMYGAIQLIEYRVGRWYLSSDMEYES